MDRFIIPSKIENTEKTPCSQTGISTIKNKQIDYKKYLKDLFSSDFLNDDYNYESIHKYKPISSDINLKSNGNFFLTFRYIFHN